MKQCSICSKTKPLDAFVGAARSRSGKKNYCKDCNNQYNREWRARNQDRKSAYGAQWRAEHKTLKAEHERTYQARRRANGGGFTSKEFDALCDTYGNKCVCCGAVGKLQSDHVIPVSQGGSNDISNIQPLCATCNHRKHTKAIDYRPFVVK